MNKYNLNIRSFCAIVLLLMSFNFFNTVQSFAQQAFENEDKVKSALLAENWEKVAELLNGVDENTESPVLRMIKGHTCLALNRNNESLSLFYMMSLEDFKKWAEWGEAFGAQNKEKSIAYYFLGDIYSRVGDFDQALKHFSKSIEINKNNFLAWNAQGVVLTLCKEYGEAQVSFDAALKLKPDFADVSNNFGMKLIMHKQGRMGAEKIFRSVTKSYPKFALAYHGLGCMELLTALKLAPEENENIQKALELLPKAQELFIENEARFTDAFINNQAKAKSLVADTGEEGTTLTLKKEFKISALADRADKIYNIKMQLPSNTSDFTKSMVGKREIQAQDAVVKEFSKMDPIQRRQFAQSDPTAIGQGLNAVSEVEKRYKNDVKQIESVSIPIKIAVDAVAVLPSKLGPVGSFGGHVYKSSLDGLVDKGVYNVQQKHIEIESLKKELVVALDNTIQNEIKTGTYRAAVSPAGYADKLGVSHGVPGDKSSINDFRGAGATTKMTEVIWDNGEWPFMPIFGLLYPVPQTKSESNGG